MSDKMLNCTKCGWEGTDREIQMTMEFNNSCVMMMQDGWEEMTETTCPKCRKPLEDKLIR